MSVGVRGRVIRSAGHFVLLTADFFRALRGFEASRGAVCRRLGGWRRGRKTFEQRRRRELVRTELWSGRRHISAAPGWMLGAAVVVLVVPVGSAMVRGFVAGTLHPARKWPGVEAQDVGEGAARDAAQAALTTSSAPVAVR